MYRILFIETGEYLYCMYEDGHLYCNVEIECDSDYHIYEVYSKEEAIQKLDYSTTICPSSISPGLYVPDNKILFEIVEV